MDKKHIIMKEKKKDGNPHNRQTAKPEKIRSQKISLTNTGDYHYNNLDDDIFYGRLHGLYTELECLAHEYYLSKKEFSKVMESDLDINFETGEVSINIRPYAKSRNNKW